MSGSTHSFLTLIPATHRVASISPLTSPVDGATVDEALIPATQKSRRSSSTTSAESNSAVKEPVLPSDKIESPVVAVEMQQTEQISTNQFLKLGN